MNGSYHIIVQSRYLKYEFDIRRNLTIIQGDSATGKTTLVELIREYHLDQNSGINLSCDRPCRVLEGDLWKEQMQFIRDSILFIDEGSSFVETEAFASAVKNSSNYYVIVTRENLEMLPISVNEVYGIRSSGKYGSLEPVYHEMYQIYQFDRVKEPKFPVKPAEILVEDSNSGYHFFSNVANEYGLSCETAGGKSNIFGYLTEHISDHDLLIIADGAAFASQMNRLMRIVSKNEKIYLYLPESFEWLLLHSGLLKDAEIRQVLENPSQYIDSEQYFSWERFFTQLLIEKTQDTYLHYSKSRLNANYLHHSIRDKVLSHMEGIEFTAKI